MKMVTAADRRVVMLERMVRDAYKACYSEHMNCPWCSGRVGHDNEDHDSFCLWQIHFGEEAGGT